MYRLNFLLLFLIPLALSAQQKELINPNGHNKFYYENGKLSSEGTLLNGKPDGYWKTYYPNGKLKSEGNRKNFELDSTWKFYNDEGKVTAEFNYKNGKKNGLKKSYDAGLNYLVSAENFVDDIKQDYSFYYYPDGKLKNKVPFILGKEDGMGFEYAEDGTIITLTEYKGGFTRKQERINRKDKEGLKQGIWKEFYVNGKTKSEGKYVDDKKNGFFKEYALNGDLLKTTKYVNDVEQKDVPELAKIEVHTDYYAGGRVKSTGGYKNGYPEGVHRQYTSAGEIEGAKVYREGILVAEGILDARGLEQGIWKEYHPNGEIKSKGEYKDGKRIGEWIFYYPNNKIEQKGKYDKKGRAVDIWKWYYESGNILREENYVNGLLEGPMTEFNDSGKVITKGEYLEGLKEGPWIYELGDYREEGTYKADKRDGEWKHFYPNNVVRFEGKFVDGNPDGKHTWYYPNGKRREEGKYIVGKKQDDWVYYNEDGSVALTITFDDDIEIKINGVKIKGEESKPKFQ